MPYLPPDIVTAGGPSQLPKATGKDLNIQIRMIEEKYRRFYSLLSYTSMKKAVTPKVPADLNQTVGEVGTTQMDPVWREQVPGTMKATGWQQPHGSGNHDVTNRGEFEEPIDLHFRVEKEPQENDLKRWGFEKVRDLLIYIPLSFFDRCGITVTTGDFFIWDDDAFNVLQWTREGFWKNTNIRLYMIINCEHRREGS